MLVAREIADAYGADMAGIVPGIELIVLQPDGSFLGDPNDAEVSFFSLGLERVPAMAASIPQLMNGTALRWLQSPGAGVDHPVFRQLLERGVRVTNASGIHAEPIAQYIFTYVLHWHRNVARHLAQQRAREWQKVVSDDLTARTIGIVGLGGIGLATARIGRAFGMRVLATRRTPAEEPDVDEFIAVDRLHELLAASDYVVLCVPFTDATRGMIGKAELAAMHSDAVLINVARGGVVDEAALITALQAGAIRGATLDVTAEEPLPAESPFWALENCVITPHDAGYSPLADSRLAALFLDNLARYARGERLRNEIFDTGLSA